jgi:hypothetical protein
MLLALRVSGNFPSPQAEGVLETHIQQIWFYPRIRLPLRFSRAFLPLSNLPLSCRAMFPCQLSPFG